MSKSTKYIFIHQNCSKMSSFPLAKSFHLSFCMENPLLISENIRRSQTGELGCLSWSFLLAPAGTLAKFAFTGSLKNCSLGPLPEILNSGWFLMWGQNNSPCRHSLQRRAGWWGGGGGWGVVRGWGGGSHRASSERHTPWDFLGWLLFSTWNFQERQRETDRYKFFLLDSYQSGIKDYIITAKLRFWREILCQKCFDIMNGSWIHIFRLFIHIYL